MRGNICMWENWEVIDSIDSTLKREEQTSIAGVMPEPEPLPPTAWNATVKEYPRGVCVPQLVALQAAATPEGVAIVADEQVLSYRELNRRANQLLTICRRLEWGPMC